MIRKGFPNMGTGKPKPSDQPLWIRLMVLTAHQGLCVYCGEAKPDVLDHEEPFAHGGADLWWNFLPACTPCNRRKNGRSARRWVADMDVDYNHPEFGRLRGFTFPPKVYVGIVTRVSKTQNEIKDSDRRDWFRHHYGGERKPRNRAETLTWLAKCQKQLKGYPRYPWTYPESPTASDSFCSRRICCPWAHTDMRHHMVALSEEERRQVESLARSQRVHEGDLLGTIIRKYLVAQVAS